MGITKDYLRYAHSGSCGCVGSSHGAVVAVDGTCCAVTAAENVAFYNMRTTEKVHELNESTKSVTCIKLNSDRRWMAVGYSDGTVRLFDRKSEDQTGIVFSGHKKGVNCLAFSNDGLTLASGGRDCTIILWDIVSESGMFRLHGHKDSVTNLQFTKNNKFLVSSSKDTFVKFWSLSSQSCFYTLLDNHSEVYSFLLLNDDNMLITAGTELELLVFELTWLESEPQINEQDAPEAKKALIEGEDIKPTGDMQNRYVRVNMRGKLLRQCKGRALQMAVTPDRKIVVCLGSDKLMDIYRVFTEDEAAKRLTKKLKAAKRKAVGNEESLAAPVSEEDVRKDVTILVSRIGDYRTPTKMKWIDFSPVYSRGEDDSVDYNAFALFSNNDVHALKMNVVLSSNVVTTESASNLAKLGHREDIRALSVSSTNSAVLSAGGSEIVVWNTHSLRPVATLTDPTVRDITAAMFAAGDGHIVAATKEGHIYMWELASCELTEGRVAHEGAVWSIVAMPDKKGFITCGADKKVKFWSYELVAEGTRKRLSMRERRILEVADEALCCTISPDSKFLVVGLLNNTASVYFVDSLKFFVSLYGHSLPVTCCTVSPNSKLVVTGSADKSIKIWGLDFGDCHKSFHAHDDVVSCVLFSPSEEMLVWSAGKDGKIKQWDAVKLQKVQVLDRHEEAVRALAQSDTGSLLFSAAHDKTLRCWELTEEIIVLEEEEEMERERDYEKRLADTDDVVAGEDGGAEAGLATTKTTQSIVSTESIIEAVDIVRIERIQNQDGEIHKPHPLIASYKSKSLDHFLVDTISRCRPSNVERSLLMVPYSYVADILSALSKCVQQHYKIEFASRIAIFLIRIHHSHVINSQEMLPIIEQLRTEMPTGIREVREITGLNLAALELLRFEIEEAQDLKLFADISQIEASKKKVKKVRKAVIKT